MGTMDGCCNRAVTSVLFPKFFTELWQDPSFYQGGTFPFPLVEQSSTSLPLAARYPRDQIFKYSLFQGTSVLFPKFFTELWQDPSFYQGRNLPVPPRRAKLDEPPPRRALPARSDMQVFTVPGD